VTFFTLGFRPFCILLKINKAHIGFRLKNKGLSFFSFFSFFLLPSFHICEGELDFICQVPNLINYQLFAFCWLIISQPSYHLLDYYKPTLLSRQ